MGSWRSCRTLWTRNTYARQIDRVTSEDVRHVAQKYLSAERLFVVAVGDPGRLELAMTNLGLRFVRR